MSRAQERNSMLNVLGSFGWPILFGLAGCSVFYGLIFRGPLANGSMQRYFATHPVAYVATAMFFIGMAALLVKLVDVVGQFRAQGAVRLDAPPDEGQTVEECGDMLDWLAELPDRARESYFGSRLRNALETVERKGTAEGLDEELKYLSDLDAERQQNSYSLVRIIIWATPMLGFLGTVVGITQALGNLDPVELASSIQTGMQKLLDGLYVAFDTTALALSLSIVLMFVQFLVERIETQLLTQVDERANEELVGRFQQVGAAGDPHVRPAGLDLESGGA